MRDIMSRFYALLVFESTRSVGIVLRIDFHSNDSDSHPRDYVMFETHISEARPSFRDELCMPYRVVPNAPYKGYRAALRNLYKRRLLCVTHTFPGILKHFHFMSKFLWKISSYAQRKCNLKCKLRLKLIENKGS